MITRNEKYEYVEQVLAFEFAEDMQKLAKDLQCNENVIKKEFAAASSALFQECYEMQKAGKKQAVSVFHICFLLSSCITGSHAVRLALYDENFYFDPVEVERFWQPEFILKYYEAEMELYEKKAKKEIIQFQYSDLQEIRLKYYEMYYQVVGEITGFLIPLIKENEYYGKVEKSGDFSVCYSRFMIPGCRLDFEK